MLKFKNNVIYVLCLLLVGLSSVSLITAFYIMRNDTVLKDNTESSYIESSRTDSAQNTTIIHNHSYDTTNKDLSQETQETDAPLLDEYTYKVTVYDDTVAVFLSGTNSPYLKLFVDLKNIPYEDKKLLEKGIYAKNKAELIKILEDYDS